MMFGMPQLCAVGNLWIFELENEIMNKSIINEDILHVYVEFTTVEGKCAQRWVDLDYSNYGPKTIEDIKQDALREINVPDLRIIAITPIDKDEFGKTFSIPDEEKYFEETTKAID